MSTRKSLLAVFAVGLGLFATSVNAGAEGVIRDVTNNTIIPANRELHFVGWTKWGFASNSFECHVTFVVKITGTTGTTGHVSNYSIPDRTKCTGQGFFAGCNLKSATATNLPWDLKVTSSTEFDFIGEMVVHTSFEGFLCPVSVVTTIRETEIFKEGEKEIHEYRFIALKPLNTTNPRAVTGTTGHLGNTAAVGNPISGVEMAGDGRIHVGGLGTFVFDMAGELELTDSDRCTWKLTSS